MHPLPAIVWIYPPLTPCQQQKLTREKLFSSGPRECFCHPQRSGVYLAPDTRTSATPREIFISATLSKSFLSNRLEFFVHILNVRFFNPLLIYLRNHKSRKFNWPMLFDIRLAANHPLERNQRYRVLNRAWTNPPMADFHGPSIKRGLSLPPSWEGTSLWTVLHALITTPPGWLTTPCASRRIRGLLPSLLGERSTSVSLCCSRRFKGGW